MIEQNYPNFSFQTFYVSKEICRCPLISEYSRLNKRLENLGLLKDISEFSVSLKYGKRMIINAKNSDLSETKPEDFLEIIDYDPLKKVLLLMGAKQPRIETSVHWIIHHAREEVKAIIQIDSKKLVGHLGNSIPVTDKEYPVGTLDQAKEILSKLRISKKVIIKNQGFIFVGNSMKDAEDLMVKTFEELK